MGPYSRSASATSMLVMRGGAPGIGPVSGCPWPRLHQDGISRAEAELRRLRGGEYDARPGDGPEAGNGGLALDLLHGLSSAQRGSSAWVRAIVSTSASAAARAAATFPATWFMMIENASVP